MPRKIAVLLSDTHGGSNVALMPPDIILHDESPDGVLIEYTPEMTASQAYLWELYQNHIAQVLELAGNDEIIVIHNGDVCQGNKYPVGLVTTRLADQVLIGAGNLSEWLKYPQVKTMRLLASTGNHAFGEASADILVTELLKQRYPQADINVMYHGLLSIGGALIDCSHHGPYPGSRAWLTGNVAQMYLRDLMIREIAAGNQPPQMVVRAHYHTYCRVTAEIGRYTSTLVTLPSYTMLDDYAHQAARSPDRVTNGLVVLEIENGEIREHKFMNTLDIRIRETL